MGDIFRTFQKDRARPQCQLLYWCRMTRDQLLAAEIFSYSFDNYANHLGIEHLRFEEYMPGTARALEQAEKEHWSDERLAKAIDVGIAEVPLWRKRYRDAVEIVDAPTPAEAFRSSIRQSLVRELEQHAIGTPRSKALCNRFAIV